MNIIFEKNIKVVPDKFILKLRDTDIVKYFDDQDSAFKDAAAEFESEQGKISTPYATIQSWVPENSTDFVKDGKRYSFYGFEIENNPRRFFLFETKGK